MHWWSGNWRPASTSLPKLNRCIAGEIETATEWLLLIKTTEDVCDRLRAALSELHSYELPECIELAIEDGSAAYLEWIGDSVR
jgi:periplasmic divalent cation tolerance protein